MDYNVIIAYAFGIFLLYLIARLLYVPLRFAVTLAYNAAVGGVLLWLFNLVTGFFNLHVAINPATALVAGYLGLPGIALLYSLVFLVS